MDTGSQLWLAPLPEIDNDDQINRLRAIVRFLEYRIAELRMKKMGTAECDGCGTKCDPTQLYKREDLGQFCNECTTHLSGDE